MRILLTGGSGTVGKEVLKLLTQNEAYEIIAFDLKNRKSKRAYKPYLDKITLIYGNLTIQRDVEQVCQNHSIDFVIHLAAIIPPLADEKPDLAYRVNTLGTQYLIQAIEKYSPQAFFLYASSISVYGDRLENHQIKVTDTIQASLGDEYGITKIKAEQLVQTSTLKWSIFRITAIMGFNNHKISGLMFHMPLSTKMEIVTPVDTGKAFANSIEKIAAIQGKIFNLGGGENCRLTYQEFLEKNFAIMGLGKVNFPDKAFAEKNFHCGYYADGDDLEAIVHFQKATLDSYFAELAMTVPVWKRTAARVFRPLIKMYLTSLSEPLHAMKYDNEVLIERFFGVKHQQRT